MRIRFSLLFLVTAMTVNAQTELLMNGKTYTNSEDTWLGVNIPRDSPTKLIFKNNSISSINRYGYLLQAGDEGVRTTNNKLDGAIITGNKLTWTGSDMKVIPHGLFMGHQKNVVVKYNYLKDVPMGIIRKSANNMSNTSGGVAYNIVKNGAVGMVVKGMSNVNIFNNTFYQERTTSQTWRPLVHIYTNTDNGNNSVAHGTKIYNNIFYTKYQTLSITIDDNESLNGFECDYNVYWCENGSPRFSVAGSVKTFEQWQAMGYDKHSVVMNPQFIDFINFVPAKRLDFGKDLGVEWQAGLAVNATWGSQDPLTTEQNGKWQAGAVVIAAAVTTPPMPTPGPEYLSSAVANETPSVIDLTYNSSLAAIIPPITAFSVKVNAINRNVTAVNVSGDKVSLTLDQPLISTDSIKVSYTQPGSDQLQNAGGGLAASFDYKAVTNNVKPVAQQPGDEQQPGNDQQPGDEPEKISLSPNPVKDSLNITITNPDQNTTKTIKIIDFSGKTCLEKQLDNAASQSLTIGLPAGFYVLRLEKDQSLVLVQKMIVVN